MICVGCRQSMAYGAPTVRCAAPAGTPCNRSRETGDVAIVLRTGEMPSRATDEWMLQEERALVQRRRNEQDANEEDNEDTATLVHHQTARSVPGGEGVGTTIPVAPNGVGCVSLSGMDGVVERRDGRMFARCAS